MPDDMKTEEQKDPRIVAAEDAAEFADLLVAAAKRRTEAAMTPGEVSAALKDTKDAAAAVARAKEDKKAAETAIKNEEAAEKTRLAVAEATKKAAEDSAKETEKTVETPNA